jgi:hypothetical protein
MLGDERKSLSDEKDTQVHKEVAVATTKRDEARRRLFVLVGSSKQIGTSTTGSPNVRSAIPWNRPPLRDCLTTKSPNVRLVDLVKAHALPQLVYLKIALMHPRFDLSLQADSTRGYHGAPNAVSTHTEHISNRNAERKC